MFPRARGEAHYFSNWWTALYESSSRSTPNALLNKTCMSDVARHVGPSIRITCRVIATKERKSINCNLSQYQKTTFQGIPTVNIRQPGNHLIKNRAWWRLQMKPFPCYWPFVRGIHRSPVNSPHKGQWRGALMFSLICALNKRLSKQSWGWWFETPLCSLLMTLL